MKNYLTKRELDVMEVLWNHSEALPASEIQKEMPDEITVSNVLPVINRLIKKKFVQIAGFSQNKKSIMREFCPCISKEEYVASLVDEKTLWQLAANFVRRCENKEMIDQLQQELDKKKEG